MTSFLKLHLFVFASLLLLLLPRTALSTNGPYYYLHVESFRAERSALRSIKNFQRRGLAAGIKKVKVAKLGDWYRVYIGSFSSRQKAKLAAEELKKRGIIKYAAIKKMDSKIATTVTMVPPAVPPKAKVTTPRPAPAIQQPRSATQLIKPPAKPPTKAKAAPKPTPPPSKSKAAAKKLTPPLTPKPQKVRAKPSITTIRGGQGRNIPGGGVVFGLRHIYREINTELTKRLRVDDGVPTQVTIADDIKNDFPTTMNQTTLRLTLGLTDYLEIFAEGGVAYDNPSEPESVYGGGMRYNLFQLSRTSRLPGFYTALHGSYLSGEFTEEYTSSEDGNQFEKNSEWQEFSAGLEIGISRSLWAVYMGGHYFDYREETERRQLENIPAPFTSRVFKDELEEKNDIGVYGGISFKFTKALALNIEGRALDQESVFVSLELSF